MTTSVPPADSRRRWLCAAACGAAIVLYAYTFWRPALMQDDFEILEKSVSWQRTWDNIWVPQNEHAMPLGRLLTFALLQLAGHLTNFPWAAALVGPVALVIAMLLIERFARRELGHSFYGLVAMILFGVTAVYQQAVFWFAASFSVITLDMLLLGLLAAQAYRQTRRWPFLLLSAWWCFVAPCWFASGVLAGPLCSLYLLSEPRPSGSGAISIRSLTGAARIVAVSALPLMGTALFLAVSLPRTAAAILHLPHYHNRHTNAIGAFQPGKGFLMTLRSIVENLLLGVFGVSDVIVPVSLVIVVLVGLCAVGFWWWRRAPCKRLLVLGLGFILANYELVYSARAGWMEGTSMVGLAWSRYHLLPQLGLALYLVGGLPAWNGRRFSLLSQGTLTRKQARFLTALLGVLLLIQLPRGILATIRFEPLPFVFGTSKIVTPEGQQAGLRRVEEVDARCREEGISAAAAKRALPWLAIPGSTPQGIIPGEFNGWDLLQGSPTPHDPETRSDEELRQLLEE